MADGFGDLAWKSGWFLLRSAMRALDSKSQTLIEESVAAQSQYLVGEKIKALMVSPPSREYKCFPSFKSHNLTDPSLPPEAQREPSGETVTELM
jgi:hypothetical protein